MSDIFGYPEHEKLHAVKDISQAIGEFIEDGLPRQNLILYERATVECECYACQHGKRSNWHDQADEYEHDEDGRRIIPVMVEREFPTSRTVHAILAQHFGIDQAKLDAEKDAMLEAMRS